ncbi:hypothetical protein MRX96_027511 [Rhipicephalus microplus]
MSGEPPTKKPAAMGKTIGTHSGNFHCDDALACFLLKQLPEYKDATVVRSRDPAVLDTCDVVVDVGAVYDPAKRRYDHHQKTFNETMNSLNPAKKWTTKLSSAGLVYVHHGREVIAETLGWKLSEPNLEKIYDKVYENFMEEIDAIDNGINAYDGEPRYRINTNVSSRVAHLNPAWNEAEPQSLRTILEGHEADRRGVPRTCALLCHSMVACPGTCPKCTSAATKGRGCGLHYDYGAWWLSLEGSPADPRGGAVHPGRGQDGAVPRPRRQQLAGAGRAGDAWLLRVPGAPS